MKRSTIRRNSKLTICSVFFSLVSVLFIVKIENCTNQRMSSREATAISALRALYNAESEYYQKSSPNCYTSILACLGSGNGAGSIPFIDNYLSAGVKAAYTFKINCKNSNDMSCCSQWFGIAKPIKYGWEENLHFSCRDKGGKTIRSYYIDESGIIRGSDIGGAIGTNFMPKIYSQKKSNAVVK
ncbi:MAG: hypothetical protein A2161_07480 [Candidatus Schekmanbacteria bacterium RBG_13_48_7]|uniref:Type II secretion system protein GspG C-terminal domain-containing protein n=1 Tax=Candidatus Schekmanbacteria bacterium RBG_13_48_7 TaxID=1817878 RepID=A0A1F7RI14_9BACT|nr:MAG: hypothetical protein A2161_07480 [Candidatus Schekmanbacteria bacterium RBG_13_48_7]